MTTRLPRAVLFDWDNTLVDTWHVIHASLYDTFTALDMTPWTLAETKSWVRRSMRDSFPELFGVRARAAQRLFYDSYESRHLRDLRLLPGARDTLTDLAEAGVYLGVVSSKNGSFVRAEAAHLELDGYFAKLVGATDSEHDKPAREAIELALTESDVAPGPDVWYVGDTGIDVVCARNAGCRAVLIAEGEARDGDKVYEPDQQVRDHTALRGFIRGLGGPI